MPILNEDDLRDCFAMFAMTGWIMNGDYHEDEIPHKAYRMADAMLEARKKKFWVAPEEDDGIATVAKRTYRRKKDDS